MIKRLMICVAAGAVLSGCGGNKAYVQKGERKAAAKAYDKALKLNPKLETTREKRAKLKA